jgi:hypothetical protein
MLYGIRLRVLKMVEGCLDFAEKLREANLPETLPI